MIFLTDFQADKIINTTAPIIPRHESKCSPKSLFFPVGHLNFWSAVSHSTACAYLIGISYPYAPKE